MDMEHVSSRAPLEPNGLKESLRGAIAFPITPFTTDGRVNVDVVSANAEWLSESGVCAIVAPSGTGEFFALTFEECLHVTRATVEGANGRVPVIAAVGFNADVAVELAVGAGSCGADGVLVMPPYYATPDRDGLADYYKCIGASTPLGLMAYSRDAAQFSPELLRDLVLEVPNLVAFKDGRGDVRQFQRLRQAVVAEFGEDRLAWLAGAGDDLAAPYFAVGATGYTSSLACFWPEMSVELFRLASRGEIAELAAFQEQIVRPIYELRQLRAGFEVSIMKAAMELLGYAVGSVRPPLTQVSDAVRSQLGEVIERLNIPLAATRLPLASRELLDPAPRPNHQVIEEVVVE